MQKAIPLILYLCSSNKDVEIVEAKTKKEIQKAKKYGNVKINKVGYKMGNTIRSVKKIYISTPSHTGTGSPKSPHMRADHHHHYWTGERNSKERKMILKFVDSMFIKGGKVADAPTVHKVKK